jgi:lipoprotein-releasing system ATP-binding protein
MGLLALKSISKGFQSGEGNRRVVLDRLDAEVNEGESLAIVGPSGSGKTTLLNLAGGLDYPDEGAVVYRGTDITSWPPVEMDRYRNREIGFVFQFHHLLPQCTLLENVLLPTLMDRQGSREYEARAEKLLKRVGIWEHRDKTPSMLSGGECQRAAVVRAMINSPSLILADEPTGALDRRNVESLAALLLELNREDKITLIVVTHSRSLAARMGRTLELKDGKLVTPGPDTP